MHNVTALSTEVLTIGRINCALALEIAVNQLEQAQDEDPWAEQARAWEEQRACDRYDRECNPDMWYGDDPSRRPYRRGW